MMLSPRQLSQELRTAQSGDLTRRRWILGLSLLGTVAGQLVSLYQMGLVKRLPDPPIGPFNSSKVDASDYAYKRFQMPDAPIMIVSYGLTAVLASVGGKDRAKAMPWVPVALGLKTVADTALALQLGREEWAENKAFCFYCQAATVASIASVWLAWPEVKKALGRD